VSQEQNLYRFAAYDAEYGVLVDEGGLLYPASEIHLLDACIAEHKKRSALKLETIARRLVEEKYPGMVN
jgi:hypothetical protein